MLYSTSDQPPQCITSQTIILTRFKFYLHSTLTVGLKDKSASHIFSHVSWFIENAPNRTYSELFVPEILDSLVMKLIEKPISTRSIKLLTVRNYVLSLQHFLIYLARYPDDIPLRDVALVDRTLGIVKQMILSIGRQSKEQTWQRTVLDRVRKPTSTQINEYQQSDLRAEIISNIQFYRGNSSPINASTYITILGFFSLEFAISNANRPAELMNMELVNYVNKIQTANGLFLVEIVRHKTTATCGPAYIAFPLSLAKLLDIYISQIRPRVVNENSGNYVFLNSVGNRVHPGAFTEYINKIWSKLNFASRFTHTLLRKTAVTKVYRNHPELQHLLSSKMNHSTATAARAYYLDDKIETCTSLGIHLPTILQETYNRPTQDGKSFPSIPTFILI